MTDIGELEEYIEANPADHEQRWRLAKKLYRACEYERALEHLEILHREWYRKLNVLRYVAATHYRLGQHEPAVEVLEEAVRDWPREVGVREQLARALEVAGRREEAAVAWEGVLSLDPKHPLAYQSIHRLRTPVEATAGYDSGRIESDSGIELTPGWTCPNCGASNGGEFERCWQCHASVSGNRGPTPTPLRRVNRPANPWIGTLVTGLCLVAFLCWGLFLFLTHLAAAAGGSERILADGTVKEALDHHFLMPRSVTALIFLVLWPYVLRLSLFLWKAPRAPRANVTIAGLLFAACLYVVLWASPSMLVYALLVPALLSLMVIVGTLRIGFPKALGVWATQLALAACLLAACFLFFVGTAPLDELDTIASFARFHDEENPSSKHSLNHGRTPTTMSLAWSSSGSAWLDELAGDVVFEVTCMPGDSSPTIEFKQSEKTLYTAKADSSPCRFMHHIEPETTYELTITASKPVDTSIALYSILKPRIR